MMIQRESSLIYIIQGVQKFYRHIETSYCEVFMLISVKLPYTKTLSKGFRAIQRCPLAIFFKYKLDFI